MKNYREQRSEISKERYNQTIKVYCENPDLTVKQIGEIVGVAGGTVGRYIDRYFREKRAEK